MTKDQAIAKAQREANRCGVAVIVLNLNPVGSLWVVRERDERAVSKPGEIVISPE